jgi:hypothetical protein
MTQHRTVFSYDRRYRYVLWRQWDLCNSKYVQFVALNCSTADELQDDPTVRRCINFAKEWGFGALCMTNLFAFRATDPRVMKAEKEPVGPENDAWLKRCAEDAGIIVAAWGNHGAHLNRGVVVSELLSNLHCLGVTSSGHPKHPLYLKSTCKPWPWTKSLIKTI